MTPAERELLKLVALLVGEPTAGFSLVASQAEIRRALRAVESEASAPQPEREWSPPEPTEHAKRTGNAFPEAPMPPKDACIACGKPRERNTLICDPCDALFRKLLAMGYFRQASSGTPTP